MVWIICVIGILALLATVVMVCCCMLSSKITRWEERQEYFDDTYDPKKERHTD